MVGKNSLYDLRIFLRIECFNWLNLFLSILLDLYTLYLAYTLSRFLMRHLILRIIHGWPFFGLHNFVEINLSNMSLRMVLNNFHLSFVSRSWNLSKQGCLVDMHFIFKTFPICLFIKFYRPLLLPFSSQLNVYFVVYHCHPSQVGECLVPWTNEGWLLRKRSRVCWSLVCSLTICSRPKSYKMLKIVP